MQGKSCGHQGIAGVHALQAGAAREPCGLCQPFQHCQPRLTSGAQGRRLQDADGAHQRALPPQQRRKQRHQLLGGAAALLQGSAQLAQRGLRAGGGQQRRQH